MTVSTKNKKSVLRALEGSGVKWLVDSELKEVKPDLDYLDFNYQNHKKLSQNLVSEGEEISAQEFVGHVWREMSKVKAKEVKQVEKKDPLDEPPVIGQEYEWNGKKVVFVKYDRGMVVISNFELLKDCNGGSYISIKGKTVRQYLADYDI